MTQLISIISNSLASLLPKNEHTQKTAELEEHCSKIEDALKNKTNQTFQSKFQDTIAFLQTEKDSCLENLHRLNGAYYQDPQSLLKKAWDSLVNKVQKALGTDVQSRDEIDLIYRQLEDNLDTEPKKLAKSSIKSFYLLEKKRKGLEKQLVQIIGTQKAHIDHFQEELLSEKQKLQQRYTVLCGKYFKDPSGLLDQAWVRLQDAITTGDSNAGTLSIEFSELENERKQIEGGLFELDLQISTSSSPDRSIEKLTEDALKEELKLLNQAKNAEKDLSGIDWKKTAIAATAITTAVFGTGLTLIASELI